MQTIYLDISNKGVVPTVYAKQNDVGRKFAVILADSGLPYIPANGSAFSVWYKGASGEGNYTDIGDRSAFSLNGNKVEVEMIVQMLSAHGDGILCLTLNSPNGNQISSWNIPYMCEIVPGSESEKAEEYYTAFSESVEKLKQVTENLTPESIGASPAGYGLGTLGKVVSSPDDAVVGGFYIAPAPSEIASSGNMRGVVFASSANWVTQIWSMNGSLIKREMESGVFKPYEWENPPMIPDAEYRTTERCEGKPVYAKRLKWETTETIGKASGVGDVNIPHGISNKGQAVRIFGFYNDTYPLPMTVSGGGSVSILYFAGANIGLRFYNATVTGKFYFDMYYTKTT